MLRGIALTVGLLAAVPAFAGEMSAEEARRFVVGKMFNYTCFEGTRGQGRVLSDGSVVGSIQFQGAGQVRYAASAGRHAAGQRRSGLRLGARSAGAAVLQSATHRQQQLPRFDLWAGLCLLRVHPPQRAHDGCAHPRTAPVRWACGLRSLPATKPLNI